MAVTAKKTDFPRGPPWFFPKDLITTSNDHRAKKDMHAFNSMILTLNCSILNSVTHS